MTLHRRNPKRDQNEADIVNALARAGAFVSQLSGEGMPDLLVIFRGNIYLVEVKAPKGKLTPAQIEYHARALNEGVKVNIAHTPLEALQIIGAID